MVPRVEKASHKEVVRIGVGEEDEDKDKTGVSNKRRLCSLEIKSILKHEWHDCQGFQVSCEKTRKSMAFWRTLSRRLCCRACTDDERTWI